MAQVLQSGTTWSGNSPNNNVTADRLNNAVNNALILPAAVHSQPQVTTLQSADELLVYVAGSGTLGRITGQNAIPAQNSASAHYGLSVFNASSGTSTTQLLVSASQIVMLNTLNNPRYVTNFAVTLDITVNGVNGRDQLAAFTAQSWIYIYAISDGTNDRALCSASFGSPTLPTGYTYKCFLGAWRIDASVHVVPGSISGKKFTYASILDATNAGSVANAQLPQISNSGFGDFTTKYVNNSTAGQWAAVDMSKCVPPNICLAVQGMLGSTNTSATNYFYGLAGKADTSQTITATTTFTTPTTGVTFLSTLGRSSARYGWNNVAMFDVSIYSSQLLYVAVDATDTKHSMRVISFTLNT